MKVSWDDEIHNLWKNKSHVPNHQPVWQKCRSYPNSNIQLFPIDQWPFQDPKLQVTTIYKAYGRPMYGNIPTNYGQKYGTNVPPF